MKGLIYLLVLIGGAIGIGFGVTAVFDSPASLIICFLGGYVWGSIVTGVAEIAGLFD